MIKVVLNFVRDGQQQHLYFFHSAHTIIFHSAHSIMSHQSLRTRAVEAPKKKAGKKAPATGDCRRLLRRLYIVNAA